MPKKKYNLFTIFPFAIHAFMTLLLLSLFVSGDFVMYVLVYLFEFITITARTLLTPSLKRMKILLIFSYLIDIITNLPRHSLFRYINEGNLTEEYFRLAEESLTDPYIYIVISNTGSPASEVISLFTRKEYNHVSIAFDSELLTIISYNGGENVYPPGMNMELIDYFNKKEDSSILVYKLKAGREKKGRIIDRVAEINREGSAYNLLGLVTKRSLKPNIMFCSQFVYNMLKFADLAYFIKRDTEVRPMDFIEMDYHSDLEFVVKFHNKWPK